VSEHASRNENEHCRIEIFGLSKDGSKRERALCVGAKAMDERKNLNRTLKEPAGV
jgi:hypothetical protein